MAVRITKNTHIRVGNIVTHFDKFFGVRQFGRVKKIHKPYTYASFRNEKPYNQQVVFVLQTRPSCFDITDRKHLMKKRAEIITQQEFAEYANEAVTDAAKYGQIFAYKCMAAIMPREKRAKKHKK